MADHQNDRKRQGVDADNRTIAAIATAGGRGGVGIVRLSGSDASTIAVKLCDKLPAARTAAYRQFKDAGNNIIDDGLIIYFPAPHSFTGEDVIELQVHGSPNTLDMLLERCIELGADAARPGEFSERAFLNGKIDLVQAEAIADLIDSRSRSAARAAQKSLQGEFSNSVNDIRQQIIDLRKYVEAAIDFTDEDIDFLENRSLVEKSASIVDALNNLLQRAEYGALLHDGVTLVIAGPPNAGKSSLLNRFSKSDTAIVSGIAGTTRDVIRENINLNGLPVTILDTAGLRTSSDEIENEGIRRAKAAMEKADHILLVVEAGSNDNDIKLLASQLPDDSKITLVANKTDLHDAVYGRIENKYFPAVAISAKSGEGIAALTTHLHELLKFHDLQENSFIARRRHVEALKSAKDHVTRSLKQLQAGLGDLMAEDLRLAMLDLGRITGEFSSDDLLGEIFSSFCIGK